MVSLSGILIQDEPYEEPHELAPPKKNALGRGYALSFKHWPVFSVPGMSYQNFDLNFSGNLIFAN